jgi:hypothetical protein
MPMGSDVEIDRQFAVPVEHHRVRTVLRASSAAA